VPDFSIGWDETLLRVVAAAALGGVVGLERELDEKAAGLRTHMLVSSGAALFTLVGAYGFSDLVSNRSYDPSRVAAQVVTGIGFLGAGVIFRQGFSIGGLTTAASLWLVAAIGMAAGAGYWAGAVIATVAALFSLRPLEWLKKRLLPERGPAHLLVQLADGSTSGEVLDAIEHVGDLLALRREGNRLEVEVRIDRERRIHALDVVAALPGVEEARWNV
jgi:putative Mg2+ transporter-C (MgtC) family protein